MKIAIAGSSGLIGSALMPFFAVQGIDVIQLKRDTPFDPKVFDQVDVVVNLAGENIATGRWTQAKKQRIRSSRVRTTQLLVHAMRRAIRPPKLLLNASAAGFYGNRGDEELTENSAPGTGFLASVCCEWEKAANAAADIGTRVILMRFGAVLSRNGGMLKALLPPFKLGLGGKIGDGHQWMSWIALEDVVGAVWHLITTSDLSGAVNLVSPLAVTNQAFTRDLGRVLHRPTFMPLPAFMAKLLFGEMADELLLSSARVIPNVLISSGYSFQLPTMTETLPHLCH